MNTLTEKTYEHVAPAITGQIGGIAVEPDGQHFWVCDANTANTINVYRVETKTSLPVQTVKLTKAGTHKASGSYVALQTDKNVVTNVWVSTYGTGDDKLFYFAPGATPVVKFVKGLPPQEDVRDLLWDNQSQRLWVTLDESGLYAVKPDGTVDSSLKVDGIKNIRRIALTHPTSGSRVWFASSTSNQFQISYFDVNTKKRNIISNATVNSEPYSMVADKLGQIVWFVTVSGELWKVENAHGDVAGMTLKSAVSFARRAQQIIRDSHDYLWVSLPSEKQGSDAGLAECLPNGQLKGFYSLAHTNELNDIGYVNTSEQPDTFYLTDKMPADKVSGIARFQPADWIDPNNVAVLSVAGPENIEAETRNLFTPWDLRVTEEKNGLTHDVAVDLVVSNRDAGMFEYVKNDTTRLFDVWPVTAKGGGSGRVSVENLYALGANGTSFDVMAMIRGRTPVPQRITQASIFSPVKRIEPTTPAAIKVHTGKQAPAPLGVKITSEPGSLERRPVTFSSSDANVKLGPSRQDAYTDYTDAAGISNVMVTAGKNAASGVKVSASCGGKSTGFTVAVRVLPTSVQLPSTWTPKAGSLVAMPFEITLNDAGADEAVTLSFAHYNDLVFVRNIKTGANLQEKDLTFYTNEHGKVILGQDSAYGIFITHAKAYVSVTATYVYEDGNFSASQTYEVKD